MTATGKQQERALRIAYFIRIPNVGDLVNPLLVTALTGHLTQHVNGHRAPHLLAVGSIMAGATQLSQIWGTGVMHPDFGVGQPNPANIHALRGALSHAALRRAGVAVGDAPLGDPGYLVPNLLGVKKSQAPKWRAGLVSHYVDRRRPSIVNLLKDQEIADLNVHEAPDVFLRRMAECEVVISTSLHGLIFAEALGIPNVWASAGDEIAGGDFKFLDWFTTTSRPQATPRQLTADCSIKALENQAELHESTIDADALIAAFPHPRIDELRDRSRKSFIPVDACRARPMPIFLISFNRGPELKRSVIGLRRQRRPVEIIVHDNGSDDPYTLSVLEELAADGVKIFRNSQISSADELNKVDETVQAFFADWTEPARYAVSDCDIDLSVADPNALDVYDELLNTHRRAECVGPMLRIRDISATYPLFNRVMNRHIEQFWRYHPTIEQTTFGQAAIGEFPIDTTFALHRAGEPFRRQKLGLRVYEPFEALHLDWYCTEHSSDAYFQSSNPAISHWRTQAEFLIHGNAPLEYTQFFAVRKNAQSDSLEIYTQPVLSDANADPSLDSPSIPPFSSVTSYERAKRLAHVEALRMTRASETERWSNPSNHQQSWAARGLALAKLVKPGEKVFEFGAGRSAVRAALPVGCAYTGSDLAPLAKETLFYDLNAASLEPIDGHDVALFSGVIEYLHDIEKISLFLGASFRAVLCSYAAYSGSSAEFEHRRYSGWFSDFTEQKFVSLFQAAGFSLSQRDTWESQLLFRFDKREL